MIIGCREQHHCKQLYRDQQNKKHSCRFHSLSRFFTSADESPLRITQWHFKSCSELHRDGDMGNKLSRTQREREENVVLIAGLQRDAFDGTAQKNHTQLNMTKVLSGVLF